MTMITSKAVMPKIEDVPIHSNIMKNNIQFSHIKKSVHVNFYITVSAFSSNLEHPTVPGARIGESLL